MNIKGTAFTTAKVTISAAFGEERWNSFMAKMAEKDNLLQKYDLVHRPYSCG